MNWEVKNYPMYYGGVKQDCAKSVIVGNLIFLSAMDGCDPETGQVLSDKLEEQMIVALDKIKGALEEVGSSMENIVKTRIFLKAGQDYSRMREIELSYYREHALSLTEESPASTVNLVRSLEDPDLLVSIEAISVLSKDRMGWEVRKYPLYYGGVKQLYSRSAVVGNLIFLSAADARSPETGKVEPNILQDLEGQLAAIHDNIELAMKEVGSSINNTIKTFQFLKDRAPRTMWKAILEYYQKHARVLIEQVAPVSTFMQVPSLTDPELLAEVEAIGIISRDRPGWELNILPLYYGENRRYFSKAAVVGNLIFCSGNAGGTVETGEVESDVLEDQMANSLIRTKLVMEEAGSSLNNIIKSFYMVKNLEDIPRIRKVELEYYRKCAPKLIKEPPAKTFIQPQSMANPRYLLEIEHIGVTSR